MIAASTESAAARELRPGPALCTVCGHGDGRSICTRHSYALMQCSCGAMYLSPAVPEDAVDHTIDVHPDSFYALPAAMKLRWLRRSHPSGRLLEVGCGNGHFLRAARAAGYEVCGIELAEERAGRVARDLGVQIECTSIERAGWPSASCDIVYHCDLLSHFPRPLLALQQMTRLLRPGGVLFFEVGIVGGLPEKWYGWMSEESIPRHRWFFSEGALSLLLRRAGLSVERFSTFGLGPQVVVYEQLSRVYQALRRLAPEVTRRTAVTPGEGGMALHESAIRAHFNNFMRFRVGALFPRMGPLTALVIARPVGSSARH